MSYLYVIAKDQKMAEAVVTTFLTLPNRNLINDRIDQMCSTNFDDARNKIHQERRFYDAKIFKVSVTAEEVSNASS